MLQIYELLEIPLFQNFRLAAGKQGLTRAITNTTILEYETFIDGFHVFKAGDFILTSLFFAKDDPKLIRRSFEGLLAREVAGIAVKTSFYDTLPQEALDYADSKNLPVFLFDDTYMEDIIVGIDEVIKKKEAYLKDERILQKFLQPHSAVDVVKFAGKFCNFLYGQYVIACLTPVVEMDMNRIFNYISYHQKALGSGENITFVKYRSQMLVIYNFQTGLKPDLRQKLEGQLRELGLRLQDFYCGIGEVHTELMYFDIALEQAITANYICRFKKEKFLTYSEIGIYQYIFPLLKNKSLVREYEKTVHILKEYDERYGSDLLGTLQVYVKNNGKIAATAKELFQHANTVRYRLQKAEELIHAENFYEYIFLVMHLYELKQIEGLYENT
ncbi:PucR family transcriptional regulator ligand-binding domain-containing protein [Roseburia hominis]